jgi:hypothetical protein
VRCALRSVASIEIVILSGACSDCPIIIRANTPMSLQRFQRLYKVFGRPYSAGASHLCRRGSARSCLKTSIGRLIGPTARNVMHPIAINEYNPTQNAAIIHTCTASALWKVGPKPIHLRFTQAIKIAHSIPQFGTLNHAAIIASSNLMGAEPSNAATCRLRRRITRTHNWRDILWHG